MISRISDTNEIKSIFREYLDYMSRFFEIVHYEPWCEGALKNLNRYCSQENCYGYVLKVSGSMTGFALVNGHLRFNRDGLAMADFFIRDGHEKKGHGRTLACHVFNNHRGNWEVAVTLKNTPALAFWENVISFYARSGYALKTKASFSGYGFVFNSGKVL